MPEESKTASPQQQTAARLVSLRRAAMAFAFLSIFLTISLSGFMVARMPDAPPGAWEAAVFQSIACAFFAVLAVMFCGVSPLRMAKLLWNRPLVFAAVALVSITMAASIAPEVAHSMRAQVALKAQDAAKANPGHQGTAEASRVSRELSGPAPSVPAADAAQDLARDAATSTTPGTATASNPWSPADANKPNDHDFINAPDKPAPDVHDDARGRMDARDREYRSR